MLFYFHLWQAWDELSLLRGQHEFYFQNDVIDRWCCSFIIQVDRHVVTDFIFTVCEPRPGKLNIHSDGHVPLPLHRSASGIPVAAACAEAAICTDKSLINTHKQQSDPQPSRTGTHQCSFSVCACAPVLWITSLKKGEMMNHHVNTCWIVNYCCLHLISLKPNTCTH